MPLQIDRFGNSVSEGEISVRELEGGMTFSMKTDLKTFYT